jgi:predicted kinase
MTSLFWMDSPQPIQFEWTMERIGRCEVVISESVRHLAAIGVSAILDLGFTRADHRAHFAAFAHDSGMRPVLHHLDIPADIRWERVEARNRDRGVTWRMDVDRAMFDFMEGQWQRPDAAEMDALNGRVIGI